MDTKNKNDVKKTSKIIQLRLENDKETLGALNELSRFFSGNTSENRRNLKSCVEKRGLDIHQAFIEHLKKVHFILNSIYDDVCTMNSEVTEMASKLMQTKTKTMTLIDETSHLKKQIHNVEVKQEVSKAIIERFQLSSSEIAALRSPNVSYDMLSAVKHAEDIKRNCKVLTQIGCDVLGQDIFQQMTYYQESGIERIFRWTQARCRTIDIPDPSLLLPQSMAKLQSRENHFEQVMDEYCVNRRDLLVRQLISALTRGGRPIEHRVTEPKRYVGDMLAWLYQAVPIEKDNLTYLLRHCDSLDIPERIQKSLCIISEGVCHPLKVRIEHILLGENNVRDPILLQSILGLLRYYHEIINKIVGPGQLLNTLVDLMETAEKTLMVSLAARIAVLLKSEAETVPSDLSLTPGVTKAIALLGQILGADLSTPPDLIQKTVACILDPLQINIMESASSLPSTEAAVFLLNNYYSIESVLSLHAFLDDRLESLKAQSEAQIDTLTSEQASSVVTHLGLGPIYTSLQSNPPKPVSRIPAFDPASLTLVAGKLAKIVANPDVYILPQLTLLSSVGRKLQIQRRAGSVVHSIYSQLYEVIFDPENLFVNPESLLPLKPEIVLQAFTK